MDANMHNKETAYEEYYSSLAELEEASSGGTADDFENAFADLDSAVDALRVLDLEETEEQLFSAVRKLLDEALKEVEAILETIPSDGEELETTIEELEEVVASFLKEF